MGNRLIALFSRYNFNLPQRVGREIKDQDMPWIFLLEEKKPSPRMYRRIMMNNKLTSLTCRSKQNHSKSYQKNRSSIRGTGSRKERGQLRKMKED